MLLTHTHTCTQSLTHRSTQERALVHSYQESMVSWQPGDMENTARLEFVHQPVETEGERKGREGREREGERKGKE